MPEIADTFCMYPTARNEDEMSEMEFILAANTLMRAFARGEQIPPHVARYSGYDVHALQRCMEMFEPELEALPGYKPLVVWLRERDDANITSEQDLHGYKNMMQLLKLYIVGSEADNWRVQTVGAYVSPAGEYLVAITEKPEALRTDRFTKELEARIYPCESETELAQVLNPLLLQRERYERYLERYRILSPLTLITKKLIELCQSQHAKAMARSLKLDKLTQQMGVALKT